MQFHADNGTSATQNCETVRVQCNTTNCAGDVYYLSDHEEQATPVEDPGPYQSTVIGDLDADLLKPRHIDTSMRPTQPQSSYG